jgi:hypothetical protein
MKLKMFGLIVRRLHVHCMLKCGRTHSLLVYLIKVVTYINKGPSWSWLYGSWIYNYLCNQCLSLLKLWVRIPFRREVPDITLCDKVCQWQVGGFLRVLRFPPPIKLTATNHDITEILLKVALNIITP